MPNTDFNGGSDDMQHVKKKNWLKKKIKTSLQTAMVR